MKRKLMILLFVIAALNGKAQKQDGETCVFSCMAKVDPSRTPKEYIRDFSHYSGQDQDVKTNGLSVKPAILTAFLSTVFDTITLSHVGILAAIDSGYKVMATIPVLNDDNLVTFHEILITGYRGKDRLSQKMKLDYFDPAMGWNETIEVGYFIQHALSAIAVKSKTVAVCHS
jgi:hypothetical protein